MEIWMKNIVHREWNLVEKYPKLILIGKSLSTRINEEVCWSVRSLYDKLTTETNFVIF